MSDARIDRLEDSSVVAGPEAYFTGRVRTEGRFAAPEPARLRGVTVTFEPGARTAWHTHPLGQTLIITAGVGWIQVEGASRKTVRVGDRIWFPPEVRHWHGATATSAMTHLALQEARDGSNVTWMEHVSDAEYDPTSHK
ncbi:MAG: cupin domain-containing protein [Pseudomonadota bacterium]